MRKKLNLTITFNFQTCQWRAPTEGRREGLVAGGKIQVHAWFKISHFLEDLTITFCLVAFKQMEKTAMMLKISLRDFWFRGLGIHDGGGWWKDLYPYPSSASASQSKIPVCRRETLKVRLKMASTVTGSLIISVILSNWQILPDANDGVGDGDGGGWQPVVSEAPILDQLQALALQKSYFMMIIWWQSADSDGNDNGPTSGKTGKQVILAGFQKLSHC